MAEGGGGSVPDHDLRRRFEGQLSKFTNVVKGWQFRWFVLAPESGRLEYYLLEERNGKCRGSQHLAGAVVLPSEEDSQTFTVNFATGEIFKLRASHARERQIWVDRLRACAHMHNEALASNHPALTIREFLPPTPPGSRSHISNGEPSEQLQNLSLSVLDAFGSVHDIIHKADEKQQLLAEAIEALPLYTPPQSDCKSASEIATRSKGAGTLSCHDEELLLLKASSQATVLCMETALAMLQDIRESQLQVPVVVRQTGPRLKTLSQGGAVTFVPPSPTRSFTGFPASTPRPRSADPSFST